MDIFIRADGGSQIGMGHIMRTLVLANNLSKVHNVFYICRIDKKLMDKYEAGIELIKKNGFNVIEINEENLKKEMKNIKGDCIITDSYEVDEEYFNICKNNFKISVYLDDENICDYFNVDLLINQNVYAKQFHYKVNDNTILMLGPQFIILREEFCNIIQKNIPKTVENIMVTVGGSDNYNITEKIINKLKHTNYKLHVVVGPGFKFKDNLKKYESSFVNLYFNANMCELMKKSDICISSCGTTLYELAAVGIPTIGLVVAENQIIAAKAMDKLNLIKLSTIENLENIVKSLDYIKRKQLSKNSNELVDGKGIYRIIDEIERRNKQ